MKVLICIALFFFAVEAHNHHRRRRDVAEDMKGLLEKFPKEEFKAFYDKLYEAMGSSGDVFEKALQENEGNLDLTVSQLKERLGANYPAVKERLDLAQAKMDSLIDRMSKITLLDAVKAVRGFFQSQWDNVDPEEAKRKYSEYRATVESFFKKVMEYQP